MKKSPLLMIVFSGLILVCAVVVLRFFQEKSYESYQSSLCSFRYPKGWTLRESKGTKDVYTQVHVFG
ncbi:MAG: hypothetical protein WC732_06820, partial [Candidatus Omnitrophota bacterium]